MRKGFEDLLNKQPMHYEGGDGGGWITIVTLIILVIGLFMVV